VRPLTAPDQPSIGRFQRWTRPFLLQRIVIMAFAIRDLSVLAYANGFTLWHYKAGKDGLSIVAGEDYFADASDMMAPGDMVMVSGGTGCQVLCVAEASPGKVLSAPLG
jgi:hypothetical protein